MTLLFIGSAALSLVWTPWPATEIDVPNKLALPSAAHWLGPDSLGRDIVSQLLVGARTSILVGVVAVLIGLLCGVALGCLAAARRGWVEEAVMRLSDFTFAFPALLSAIMLGAIYGPGLLTGIVAIGSGGPYAQAAARGLLENTELTPAEIVGKSLSIAGDLCIYTNQNHLIETLD